MAGAAGREESREFLHLLLDTLEANERAVSDLEASNRSLMQVVVQQGHIQQQLSQQLAYMSQQNDGLAQRMDALVQRIDALVQGIDTLDRQVERLSSVIDEDTPARPPVQRPRRPLAPGMPIPSVGQMAGGVVGVALDRYLRQGGSGGGRGR